MMSTSLPEEIGMSGEGGADAPHATEVAAAIGASFMNMTANILSEFLTPPSNLSRLSSRRRNNFSAILSSPSMAILVLDALNVAYMPVIIYLGIIGNILSLVTFLFTKLRSRTSSLYLGALAVSDSGFLIVLSFAWLNERGINVYQHGLCLLTVFLSSAFACWSVWLTVSFTAERFVAVRYPLWKLQTSSPIRRSRLVIGATAFLSVLLNAPLLAFVHVDTELAECSLNPEYESALYYLNLLDTVLTFVLPFLLITVMNLMIARAIYLFYIRYKEQRATRGSLDHFEQSQGSSASRKTGDMVVSRDGTMTATSGGGIAHATQISVTRMLLLVSTVFILLNLPSYVMRIYVFLLSLRHSTNPDVISTPYVLQRYFMLLYYTNFSINFVLYNAGSRMFRATLCDSVQRCWLALRVSMAGLRSRPDRSPRRNEDIVI